MPADPSQVDPSPRAKPSKLFPEVKVCALLPHAVTALHGKVAIGKNCSRAAVAIPANGLNHGLQLHAVVCRDPVAAAVLVDNLPIRHCDECPSSDAAGVLDAAPVCVDLHQIGSYVAFSLIHCSVITISCIPLGQVGGGFRAKGGPTHKGVS